jgi:hypothetical protein
MIESLIKCFLFFTLLFIPITGIYYQGGSFNDYGGLDGLLARFSLGNIPQANSFCSFTYLSRRNHVEFSCHKGLIGKINHFGIMPTDSENFEENYCGTPTKYPLINDCTNLAVN